MPSRGILACLLSAGLLAACAAEEPSASRRSPDAPRSGPQATSGAVAPLVASATTSTRPFLQRAEWEGFRNLSGGAQGILIIPSATRIGLIVGVEEGAGLLMARHGGAWSDPVFVRMSNYNIGFLAGASDSTVAMMLLTRAAIQQFVEGSSRLSAAGAFALGSWGVGAIGAGGISGGAQAITAETSRGLFAGGGLGSAQLSLDEARNREAYGAGFQASRVLAAPGGGLAAARELRGELARAAQHAFNGP